MVRRRPKRRPVVAVETPTTPSSETSSPPLVLAGPSGMDASSKMDISTLNALEKFMESLKDCPEAISILLEVLSNLETSPSKKHCLDLLKMLSDSIKDMNPKQIEYIKKKLPSIFLPESLQKIWIFQDDFEDYNRPLGRGTIGNIYFGKINTATMTRLVAIKKNLFEDDEEFMEEAEIMSKLDNPNILEILGFTLDGFTGIFTEYMEQGSLTKILERPQQIEETLRYFLDIANGLEYLHNKKYVHRDLCARNIFVSGNKTCKIGGFARCKYLGIKKFYSGYFLTYDYYTAPEVKSNNTSYLSSDIYSMGVLIVDIMYAPKSLADYFVMPILQYVSKKLPLPDIYPASLIAILRGCFAERHVKRPNARQLKECILKCQT